MDKKPNSHFKTDRRTLEKMLANHIKASAKIPAIYTEELVNRRTFQETRG